MDKNETLRPKFYRSKELALEFANDPEVIYTIGFYAGQMEKVLIGACRYCMFRPDVMDRDKVFSFIYKLVQLYNLQINQYCNEIWVSKPGEREEFDKLCSLEKNSVEYHKVRALMCGVNFKYIDSEYHLRSGHQD